MVLRVVIALMALALVTGCSTDKREDLRSPCVGVEGSPCGPKRNVNDWWMA